MSRGEWKMQGDHRAAKVHVRVWRLGFIRVVGSWVLRRDPII